MPLDKSKQIAVINKNQWFAFISNGLFRYYNDLCRHCVHHSWIKERVKEQEGGKQYGERKKQRNWEGGGRGMQYEEKESKYEREQGKEQREKLKKERKWGGGKQHGE